MRNGRTLIATAALGMVVLAACSSGNARHGSGTGSVGAVGVVPKPAVGAPDAAGSANGTMQPARGAYDSNAGGGSAASQKSDTGGTGELPLDSAVIRTASISVKVKDLSAADQVRAIAEGVGGTVDGDNRSSGRYASATLILAVPPGSLGDVLARISALGTEKSRTSSSQDVTQEVADVNSRVSSAQAAIDQLKLLFHSATRVGDLIAIESELAQRESDLESLQAQQRALTHQTEKAHVTVSLTTGEVVAKKHDDHSGFVGGLRRGWDAFAGAVVAVLTGVGVAIPFVLLVAVLGGAGVFLFRRHRRMSPPPVADGA